jgi:hypothetical protein
MWWGRLVVVREAGRCWASTSTLDKMISNIEYGPTLKWATVSYVYTCQAGRHWPNFSQLSARTSAFISLFRPRNGLPRRHFAASSLDFPPLKFECFFSCYLSVFVTWRLTKSRLLRISSNPSLSTFYGIPRSLPFSKSFFLYFFAQVRARMSSWITKYMTESMSSWMTHWIR